MKKILIDIQCLQTITPASNELSKFCLRLVDYLSASFEVNILIHSNLNNVNFLKHQYSNEVSCQITFFTSFDSIPNIYSEINQQLYESCLYGDNYTAILFPEISYAQYTLGKYYKLPIYAFSNNLEFINLKLKHDIAEVAKLYLVNSSDEALAQLVFLGLSKYVHVSHSYEDVFNVLNQHLSELKVAKNVVKPKLAYCSPLPPEQTGIADYSSALLPFLSRYYNITLINDNYLNCGEYFIQNYSIKSYDYLVDNYSCFDRVIYHLGNNPIHVDMFTKLSFAPGVVMMHDSNISDLMIHLFNYDALEAIKYCVYNKLYHLINIYSDITSKDFFKYLHLDYILDKSLGVMLHSEYNMAQIKEQYEVFLRKTRQINFCAMMTPSFKNYDIDSLRIKYKVPQDSFVLSSFGGVNHLKLIPRIIEVAKRFKCDDRVYFLIVGSGEHLDEYKAMSKKYGLKNISFTGRVSHAELVEYYQLTDIALQFRLNSRGETSAAIFDCMLLKIPVVVNNYGTSAYLSDKDVIKVLEDFSIEELNQLILELLLNKYDLSEYANSAYSKIIADHNPSQVAMNVFNNIEEFYLEHQNRKLQLSHKFSTLDITNYSSLANLLVTINDKYKKIIYFDISELHLRDYNTGIQRVIKIILKNLIYNYSNRFIITPIYFLNDKCYIANKFIYAFLSGEQQDKNILDFELPAFMVGSIYLCLDFHWYLLNSSIIRDWLLEQKKHSCLYHVQYDLIPITNSEYCDKSVLDYFERNLVYLRNIMDGVVAISKAVANDYIEYSTQIKSENMQNVGYFHLGCDIDNYNSHHISDKVEDLSMLDNKKFMLMVSTIEPRKSHSQVLEAFEKLWLDNSEYCLVLIGKQGWNIDELIDKISKHPLLNKKLFWLQGISDQALTKVYEMSTAFIMASFTEGFGLGIVESVKYNKPLILRDIPVFREIAENNAYYFNCLTGDELAIDLNYWIDLYDSDKEPKSDKLKTITWKESCDQLMDVILNNKWYNKLL